MTENVTSMAAILYDAVKDDPTMLAELKNARASLARSFFISGNTRTVTVATQNGASFSFLDTLPIPKRLKVLDAAIKGLENNYRPSNTAFSRF